MAEIDIAAVFQLLGSVAVDMREMKSDVRGVKTDVAVLQRDMADVKHGLASLNQTVAEYHASMVGHDITITDQEERVRRIERHLHLPPTAAE